MGEAEQGRKGLARADFSLVPGELWNVNCAQSLSPLEESELGTYS